MAGRCGSSSRARSCSILAEKYGRFLANSARGRSEAIQWLMWQMAGLGPMLGQGQHFWSYAKEKQPYAIKRYTKEGQRLLSVMDRQRLLSVMDRHLEEHEYLADEYSIADIACFPWVRIHKLTAAAGLGRATQDLSES